MLTMCAFTVIAFTPPMPGRPGIIVVNLKTGEMRRVLNDLPATTAPADRPIVVAGSIVMAPDAKALRVHADPMEVSPDGRWALFRSAGRNMVTYRDALAR